MTLAIFQSVGPFELLIVLGIVLVIFGPKRLPGLGRQLGTGMREVKGSLTGRFGDDDDSAEGSRGRAEAALGGPERETREPEPAEAEVVSEKP